MKLTKRQKWIALGGGGALVALAAWFIFGSTKTEKADTSLVDRVVARAVVSETDLGVLRELLAKLQAAGRADLAIAVDARIKALEQKSVFQNAQVAQAINVLELMQRAS